MRLFVFLLITLASAAQAQTFNLSLGGDPIGTLSYSASAVRSDVNNSPLGVADGVFEGTANRVQTADGQVVTQYLGKSFNKGRTISVLMQGGRALETTVSPASEATALSDAAVVPAGITHPIGALGHLVGASGCPGAVQFYDGRRVILISPESATQSGSTQTCNMRYRVTAGPGHMSPLFISRASMTLTYEAGRFQQMQVKSGPFSLFISR